MKLIGKTSKVEVREYKVYDNFPYEWIKHKSVRVTTYWFLFIPVYKAEEEIKGE